MSRALPLGARFGRTALLPTDFIRAAGFSVGTIATVNDSEELESALLPE